ncbi:TPA: TonB-dependent hemoglobin/transferrin/lactoferrin family receptor [Mannheimia haemolytica]
MQIKQTVLAIAITPFISQLSLAQETKISSIELDTIEVNEQQENLLKQQAVMSNEDLVRYSTDMGVPQTGRFGSQGFNIRGVEGNQVAVTVDGISQAASNNYATFSRYSYYNKSRPEIDTELMSDVTIEKGSSTKVGNGALGGSVNYETKTVSDILMKGRQFGGMLKYTYNGQNKENIETAGIAADGQYADALVMYSHRQGHETQTTSKGPDIMGSGRGLPNPYKNNQYSYLAKLGLKWNDENRLELKTSKQRSKNAGQELSYSTVTLRDFFDVQEIETYGVTYLYTPKNSILENIKVAVTKQDTEISGINDQITIARGTKTDNTKRAFNTKNVEGSLGVTFKPVDLGNTEHKLSTELGYGVSDFSFDMQTYTAGITPTDQNMQSPAKTKSFHILMGDSILLTQNLSAHLNARYEQSKLHSDDNSLSDKTFNNWAGDIGLNYQLSPVWQIGYKLSRGFRTPTASEMFFNREVQGRGASQTFLANTNLKPETSLGNEISLVGNGSLGSLSVTAYHTHYRNLIDLATIGNNVYQSQNVNRAKIKGVDINGTLDLNTAWNAIPQGFELNGGFGYTRGKRNDGSDLLTVQPLKALFGIGYRAVNNDWAIHLNGTYTQGKKAKYAQQYAILANTGYLSYDKSLTTYPYLSNSATVFDLVAHKKFGERAIVKVGVYNLFNKKYWTWDSLRTIGITSPGVANSITGEGLNRYLSPERYVMASVEFKF